MSPYPPVSTWTPTWVTTAGYVFIIVESYYYGMIPYSCYTANSYPESIISISLNGGSAIETNTKLSTTIVPFFVATPPAAGDNYKVTV